MKITAQARSVYQAALAKAKQEAAKLNADQERITKRLAKLEPVIYALQRHLNPGWSDAKSLTDAVRQAVKFSARPLFSREVYREVEKTGKLKHHSQPLATVSALLPRLVKSEEVVRIKNYKGSRWDGYWWAAKGKVPTGEEA